MGHQKIQSSKTALRGNKFVRRSDLTPSKRLYIAYTALRAMADSSWGTITFLAQQFMISRMFVYMLANSLEQTSFIVFGDHANKPTGINERVSLEYILSLRLEGKCSISSISTIMKRFLIKNGAVGSISECLQYIGALLPNTLSTDNNEAQLVVFVSDEIFSKNIPLLVTVDPISSAILRIELADTRKAEDWKNHWECLEKNGYYAIYLVSDEGKGLSKAHKEALADIIRQPDTYHAIAHQLGQWTKILEDAAYKAIENETDRYDKLDSAKSDPVISKRIDQYEDARQKTNDAIELYENFSYLYKIIIAELDLFDDAGNLRDRTKAEERILAGLELLKELNHHNISKAVKKVLRVMPDLLQYFDIAREILDNIELPLDEITLQVLCLAWQCKKKKIKAKKAETKKYYATKEQEYLQFAAECLQEEYEAVKEQIYGELDRIVQGSGLVECINSIIRPYLNTSKNQVKQHLLNLIMFYHNHRRYKRGERKGKTPMEILTGKKQDKDWIKLLLDIVEKKDPSFIASFS